MLNFLSTLPRHQLARDLLGTIAPFTAFWAAVLIANPQSGFALLDQGKAYLAPLPIVLGILFYAATAYIAGKLVNTLAVTLTRMAQTLPKVGQRFSYAYWYGEASADIESLYERTFCDLPFATILGPTDKVNALKHYFRTRHREAYAEVSRQFLWVDLVRSAFVYAAILLAWELQADRDLRVLVAAALIMVGCAVAIPRRIHKVVRSEFIFLLASARLTASPLT